MILANADSNADRSRVTGEEGFAEAGSLQAALDEAHRRLAEQDAALLAAAERCRDLEGEIQHALKLQSLGLLSGGIAHDMNNVLGAIYAVCETLQVQRSQDEPLLTGLALIEKAAVRGRDLVKQVTGFARKSQPKCELLDLNLLVQEERDLLARTSFQKLNLVLNLEDNLPRVRGERGALGSALMNLCANAMDAMPDGGTLTLSTHSLPDAQVVLGVVDTGTGMTPEVLARARESFFTTKAPGKGTGLGLSMVQATALAHGGSISLRSTVGQGTSAHIYLPTCPTSDHPKRAQLPASGLAAPRRILLVDDDELIRYSVQALLQAFGHQVTAVSGGEEALVRLRVDSGWDLVILDLNMPGMDGAETLAALRRRQPELPVILATGYLDGRAEALLKDDPWLRGITKPFLMEDLNRMIGECIGLAAGHPSGA